MILTLVGCGSMGEALLAGCFACNLTLHREVQVVRRGDSLPVKSSTDELLVLAVKPVDYPALIPELLRYTKNNPAPTILSVMAGVSCERISKDLAGYSQIARAMPNLPSRIREGVTALYLDENLEPQRRTLVLKTLSAIGKIVTVETEAQIDAATAISGSGPAYVAFMVEQLISAAEKIGLSTDVASELVREMLSGTAALLSDKSVQPAQLRNQVTSKGGTTAAALAEFERLKFSEVIDAAVGAAFLRAKELNNS